ncbi:hypothetical protein B5K08_05415 [Rhizobium leguminosarum bv. trifolii]|uniref:Uncharacterized protein n=1 Tax=Rhizobium leguminosarum bv. trifolii TaxID=386 RepID=A0A3E1BXD3_RHILT|nr:hypothetical protein [Rhizobium leguminosarum]RFB97988.1 hypothetical protein B5K08_05415 [Rhizobium leguminosarum bv. trifolii]RFB99941.1 hypothetical protein B5K10_05405 [Rhizobium leguminosarum bv. trifolii]
MTAQNEVTQLPNVDRKVGSEHAENAFCEAAASLRAMVEFDHQSMRVSAASTASVATGPQETSTSGWTELSDRTFIRAVQECELYREDWKRANTSKLPRLPIPLLHSLRDAGVAFDRALTMLPVSPTHLRAACIRAGVVLDGRRLARPTPENTPLNNRKKEPDMPVIQNVIQAQELTDGRSEADAQAGKRRRGKTLREKIRAIAQEIADREGQRPTYIRLHREYGFAMKTIRNHLAEAPRPYRHRVDPAPDVSPTEPKKSKASPELTQMISEIVFGAALVPGTYLDAHQIVRCDDFEKSSEGLTPLVQKWRQHEAETVLVIKTYRELVAS